MFLIPLLDVAIVCADSVLQKPLDIEVIPVIDEVEIEADDESSELEEESLQNVFEEGKSLGLYIRMYV